MKKYVKCSVTILLVLWLSFASTSVVVSAEDNGVDTVLDSEDHQEDVTSTTDEDLFEPTIEELLNTDGKYHLYFSASCPHCETVKEFIVQNDLSDKITFKEVISSEDDLDNEELVNNGNNLGRIQDYLGESGVPCLLKDGQYWMGDSPIISELRDEYDLDISEKKDNTVSVILGSLGGIVVMIYVLTKLV